jgi:hypothetical protein
MKNPVTLEIQKPPMQDKFPAMSRNINAIP